MLKFGIGVGGYELVQELGRRGILTYLRVQVDTDEPDPPPGRRKRYG